MKNTNRILLLGGIAVLALLLMSGPGIALGGTDWEYDDQFSMTPRVPQQVQQIQERILSIEEQMNDHSGDGYDWTEESQVPLAKSDRLEDFDFTLNDFGDGYDFLMEEETAPLPQIVVPRVRQSIGDYNDFEYWNMAPVEREAKETRNNVVQECFEYDIFCNDWISFGSDNVVSAEGEVDCETYPDVASADCLVQDGRLPNTIPTPAEHPDYP